MFNIDKIIGMITYIFSKCNVNEMEILKLMKLLYISDRCFIEKYNRSISHDRFCSLPRGPVLSKTLNFINSEAEFNSQQQWDFYFERVGYLITLKSKKDDSKIEELSRAETKIIDQVISDFGDKDRFELVNYTHSFPEWKDPNGSSYPIHFKDILRTLGRSEEEINIILKEEEIYQSERV